MHIDTLGAAAEASLPARLGMIRMTGGSGPDDEAGRIATIRAGLDAGITRLHTADYAGTGRDELLLREALRGRDREQVQLSVSFGLLCDPAGAVQGVDTRPAAVKSALAYSLRRLGTDYVDTYRPARLSPDVPVEDTVGAIVELVDAGYVRNVGLGDVGPETLRRAATAHPISDLLIEYSIFSREAENDVLPAARELGIAVNAYGTMPRAAGNSAVGEAARSVDATVGQAAIAWVLSRGPDVVALIPTSGGPGPGDVLDAARLRLGPDELARIEDAAARHCAPSGPAGAAPAPEAPDLHRARTVPLTGREAEVLALLTGGITNRSIANRLGISERTVREHVARILLKLRVESRVKAAVVATEWRLGGYRTQTGQPPGPDPMAAPDGQFMPPL